MLASLHVKNLALIDEEEIVFSKGLNILSGETGAGKSIILGALHLCLGDKTPGKMLRDETEEALVESVFLVKDEEVKEKLRSLDVEPYDDEVILTRRITESRSVAKINGEQVPASKLKEVGELLLDIYGQKEHQSLLSKQKHMELLDDFCKEEIKNLKDDIKSVFKDYNLKKKELEQALISESTKDREIILLEHEINEITAADIKLGEDEALEDEYKRLNNFSRIVGGLSKAYGATSEEGAADCILKAVSELKAIEAYDDRAASLLSMLLDVEAILSDFNREVSSILDDDSFDEGRFREIEQRLNEINRLKDKYGSSIEKVFYALKERLEKKERFEAYDEYVLKLREEVLALEEQLQRLSDTLSDIRKAGAFKLSLLMQDAMADLNFMSSDFSMELTRLDHFTENGIDDGQFMISTNPGEPLRPLKDIASGGEMSRIMLAIKTVLAQKDDIDTLIFDEIDAGISGRTAQAVSEKLSVVGKNHQVICITHLPQIAAMADAHFLIEKSVEMGHTVSGIKRLNEEASALELSRMLGGSVITDAVMENAKELKKQAIDFKSK
ncbi:MAG: DNA repair protein RecN [Pseudobutyrivibrio sp.]|mgnify:FL=1|nr:DNA repair protein RecN [Pseudobutyrivibrio sp.]